LLCIAAGALALSCREERARQQPAEPRDASPTATVVQRPIATLATPSASQGSETPFTVNCSSETLRGSTGAGWTRAAATTDEYPARWSLATRSGAPAWAWVQCLPPRRTGFTEIDALYRRWRKPDGSLLREVGTGYSGLSLTDTMRTAHVESGGVLAEPLPGAPSAQVGGVYGAVTYILEAPKATFAFEIVGEGPSPAAVSAAIVHTSLSFRR
jgi:hypothetical protein